jgi:hypothetical protein
MCKSLAKQSTFDIQCRAIPGNQHSDQSSFFVSLQYNSQTNYKLDNQQSAWPSTFSMLG